MNQQAPTDNNALFQSYRRLPATTDSGEASWLSAPREGFTAQQDAQRARLSNSPEGRKVSASFILGHVGGRK